MAQQREGKSTKCQQHKSKTRVQRGVMVCIRSKKLTDAGGVFQRSRKFLIPLHIASLVANAQKTDGFRPRGQQAPNLFAPASLWELSLASPLPWYNISFELRSCCRRP